MATDIGPWDCGKEPLLHAQSIDDGWRIICQGCRWSCKVFGDFATACRVFDQHKRRHRVAVTEPVTVFDLTTCDFASIEQKMSEFYSAYVKREDGWCPGSADGRHVCQRGNAPHYANQCRCACGKWYDTQEQRWVTTATPGFSYEAQRPAPYGPDSTRLLTQLAGCLTAAEGGTGPGLRATPGMYGWSPAYKAVYDLRLKYDALVKGIRTAASYEDQRNKWNSIARTL